MVNAPARRRWLKHCSAAVAAGLSAVAMPSFGAVGARARTLLVVGDSLSAEYGLQRGTGWVALLQKRLAQAHAADVVVNASISGDTTAGGLARLPALLKLHQPRVVII